MMISVSVLISMGNSSMVLIVAPLESISNSGNGRVNIVALGGTKATHEFLVLH